jgi:uncharacterized protein YgfB (UPF0149 family)
MPTEHDKKVDVRETYHLLKDGPDFRKRLLIQATSMGKEVAQKLSDEDFALALQEFQKQAGIK